MGLLHRSDRKDPPPPYTARADGARSPHQTANLNPLADQRPIDSTEGKKSTKSPAPPSPTNLAPPYDDQSASGSSPPSLFGDASRYAGPPQPSGVMGNVARQFPPVFALYSNGMSLSRSYMIGPHQNEPLYAVELHTGMSSSPPLVLHNGPDASCPMLASLEFHTFRSSVDMMVPPLPGMSGSPEIKLQSTGSFHRSYMFSIEVGLGGQMRSEMFEWRHSYGAAIEALDGDFDGYKLVRLERGPPPGMPAGARYDPGQFAASDGLEVVAAWTDARLSWTKQGKFAFIGTGQSGLLGERWAVAAVLSALAIWEIQRRRKRNNAS
ncbi:uncharacterized protein PgNI_02118 [Pyricularia grisea]|uniref:Uncharacterized protein n=1 Tax=Pyricularia grisea TaxID=148305 RepID=A0A6P8BIM4_PYRGI|nr:uncharacterized protein PgNI_02118 [Pyricularia grisea]TLD16565.1 hypothetical protein PgNI_02118 [Pyricularia grisea]